VLNVLPAALASAAVGSLPRSVTTGTAGLASPATSWTPLPRPVASLARPSEPRLGVSRRASGVPTLAKALTGSIAVELTPASTPPRLTNREVGGLTLWALPLRARQGGANQTPVNRAVILDAIRRIDRHVVRIGSLGIRWIERLDRRKVGLGNILGRLNGFGERFGTQRTLHRFTGCSFRAFSAQGRNLCPFEFVVRVAGSAASLYDLILNHGHHGMTGDAALTGTVIVQDVTEPRPALLH